jgi:hypothetical protein
MLLACSLLKIVYVCVAAIDSEKRGYDWLAWWVIELLTDVKPGTQLLFWDFVSCCFVFASRL